MPTLLLVPGYACTSDIWDPVTARLPDQRAVTFAWDPAAHASVRAARDALAERVRALRPGALVGHSMGGLLLLELQLDGRIPRRPTLIADAFLTAPADVFKNHVWADAALRARVQAMLAQERARHPELLRSIQAWGERPGWPQAAIDTGAHFVYGGRDLSPEALVGALGWPAGAATPTNLSVLPQTSHFLMLEDPRGLRGGDAPSAPPRLTHPGRPSPTRHARTRRLTIAGHMHAGLLVRGLVNIPQPSADSLPLN